MLNVIMVSLGVISCSVLTNELAYLVRQDPEVSRVVVVDTPEGRHAVQKLGQENACPTIELVEESEARPTRDKGLQLIVVVNPSDLHNSQERMKKTLVNEISKMANWVDGILLLYGQCRCQSLDLDSLQEDCELPIAILRDRDDTVIDDCIAATLGGRKRYLDAMKRYKGAVFATPGYVENYANLHIEKDIEHIVTEVEELKMILDALGYSTILKLDAQLDGYPDFDRMVNAFGQIFDLEVTTLACNLAVFEDSYNWAKTEAKEHAKHRGRARARTGVEVTAL